MAYFFPIVSFCFTQDSETDVKKQNQFYIDFQEYEFCEIGNSVIAMPTGRQKQSHRQSSVISCQSLVIARKRIVPLLLTAHYFWEGRISTPDSSTPDWMTLFHRLLRRYAPCNDMNYQFCRCHIFNNIKGEQQWIG